MNTKLTDNQIQRIDNTQINARDFIQSLNGFNLNIQQLDTIIVNLKCDSLVNDKGYILLKDINNNKAMILNTIKMSI